MIKKYLADILVSIESIEEYLGEKRDFFVYQNNKMLRRAIEREFEIIAEALKNIMKSYPEINISSKHQIIGMRNRVIHNYDKIDDEIMWGTIVKYLPILKKEVRLLIDK